MVSVLQQLSTHVVILFAFHCIWLTLVLGCLFFRFFNSSYSCYMCCIKLVLISFTNLHTVLVFIVALPAFFFSFHSRSIFFLVIKFFHFSLLFCFNLCAFVISFRFFIFFIYLFNCLNDFLKLFYINYK